MFRDSRVYAGPDSSPGSHGSSRTYRYSCSERAALVVLPLK